MPGGLSVNQLPLQRTTALSSPPRPLPVDVLTLLENAR